MGSPSLRVEQGVPSGAKISLILKGGVTGVPLLSNIRNERVGRLDVMVLADVAVGVGRQEKEAEGFAVLAVE